MAGWPAALAPKELGALAVALVGTDGDVVVHSAVDVTEVVVGEISEERLAWYVDSGDADDKAGAYGLQGAAGLFADRIEGSANGVIGLSLALVDRLFAAHGLDLMDFRSPAPIDPVEAIAARALRHVTRPPGRDEHVACATGRPASRARRHLVVATGHVRSIVHAASKLHEHVVAPTRSPVAVSYTHLTLPTILLV